MRTIAIILLVLLLLGFVPLSPWASGWDLGWYPSGTFLLVIVILLLFF
jgi:hypothetical protein